MRRYILFHENLKKVMKEKKISQTELAEAIGASQATVSYWLKNKASPTVENFEKIIEYLNVDANEILGRKTRAPDKLTSKEKELIRYYRKMDERSKEYILESANREASRGHPTAQQKSSNSLTG